MTVPYQPRKGMSDGEGADMFSTTVASSGASMVSTVVKNALAGAAVSPLMVSNVYFTSAAVTGSPSCQSAPETRWKVLVNPSSDVSQVCASSGIVWYELSRVTRVL